MNCRVLVAVVLVAACPTAAFAAPPDDTDELAAALIAQGWPDLAEDLLARASRDRGLTWDEEAAAASAHLAVLQEAASGIADPYWRKEALLDLLAQTDTFVGRFEGIPAAEQRRKDLPGLCSDIGEAIIDAIGKSQDASATESLRAQGETVFARAEKQLKARIDAVGAAEDLDEEQNCALMSDRYNHARLLYFHALVFPRESARRKELCTAALKEYDEFDLHYGDGDEPSILAFYAYVDRGLCLEETGAPDEAIKSFEKTIELREWWGPKDESGVWPIPAGTEDVIDLVCYATLQKAIVLRGQKKLDDVVRVGRDWFVSMPKPFGAPSSMVLAWELANAQFAAGDAKGAAATAESMIREDPDGVGGAWGRALLDSDRN
jgi:tetratricopeptide (TPR) repeat protein